MKHNTGSQHEDDVTSTSRRVADALHEQIDGAAEKGEKFERTLHEKRGNIQEKSRELNGSMTRLMHDKPWAVVGGALAVGVVIGALSRR
jgi:ElaB/YqjD/DUF883 family membrane-anchored ribosome-binding protein